MTSPARPPYRAEHVGSLLLPAKLEAGRRRLLGQRSIDPEELAALEDETVVDAVRMQQDAGMPAVTDGALRRSLGPLDFIGALGGVALEGQDDETPSGGATARPVRVVIRERLEFPQDHPMLGHFRHLASVAEAMPKFSLPGPGCCHDLVAARDVHPRAYRDDPDALFADLAQVWARAVKAFHDTGCRYLQIDGIAFAGPGDAEPDAAGKPAGADRDRLLDTHVRMIAEAISGRPDGMAIGLHLGRAGPQHSAAGDADFDRVADAVLNAIEADVYFLECDAGSAGTLAPLRLLPRGRKRIMAGLVASRSPKLETLDTLRRRLDEAARLADLDQIGIAPGTGFAAAADDGLSEDDQKRKLDLVVRTAEAVWGSVDK